MNPSPSASWSLRIGRWRSVELRLHVLFPLLALAALAAATPLGDFAVGSPIATPREVLLGLAVLLASVLGHEIARATIAQRVGGRMPLVILAPWGGAAAPQLPSDPPAHLVTAVTGPLVYLVILVTAGCALVLGGERNVLGFFSPFSPRFGVDISILHLAAQLAVWLNVWLLLVNMMPIDPCDGAEVLRGLLWPVVGRASAAAAASHIAYGAAAMTAVLALAVQKEHVGNDLFPAWFPLSVLSVLLLYGGNRAARQRRYDMGLAIDELESDDEQWLTAEWLDEERAAVLVEHIQEKQQEALERKRREREDREDARVDDILARLQAVGFDKLSEEEQAILKRASRRYRQRRGRPQDAHGG